MIKIKDFSFTYKTRKGEQAVFQNLDLELPSGFTVILGPNGAGKSTMIKIIGGVHPQTKGEILLKGDPVRFKDPNHSMKSGISKSYWISL